MVYGGLLVTVILWRPRGVYPWFARVYSRLLARLPGAGRAQA
jgi:hypothetical protein